MVQAQYSPTFVSSREGFLVYILLRLNSKMDPKIDGSSDTRWENRVKSILMCKLSYYIKSVTKGDRV